jgi:hypothetical protein
LSLEALNKTTLIELITSKWVVLGGMLIPSFYLN